MAIRVKTLTDISFGIVFNGITLYMTFGDKNNRTLH